MSILLTLLKYSGSFSGDSEYEGAGEAEASDRAELEEQVEAKPPEHAIRLQSVIIHRQLHRAAIPFERIYSYSAPTKPPAPAKVEPLVRHTNCGRV